MKKLTGILLGILAILVYAVPVLAIALPDSTPQIIKKYAYRNLIESGDVLFIWEANIPYAVTPDVPVTEAFMWRLIAADGVTELGQTTGYVYNDSGYGYNVYSLYFSAADALAWAGAYTLRLRCNPIYFTDPKTYNFPINAADYTSLTTQAANQAALAATILEMAQDLNVAWGLTPATSLITEDEASTVLSIYGESVFRGSVYGLQAMAPAAFSHVITSITVTDRTWTDGYSANVTAQYNGTWIQTAKAAGATLWGTSYDLTSIILVLIACGLLIVVAAVLGSDIWSGLVLSALSALIFARLGFYPLTFFIMIGALVWIYFSAKVWGQLR